MVGDTVLKSPIKAHEQKVLTRPKHLIDAKIVTFSIVLGGIIVHSHLFLRYVY